MYTRLALISLLLCCNPQAWGQITNYHNQGTGPVYYTEGVPFEIVLSGTDNSICNNSNSPEDWRMAVTFFNLPSGWQINSIISSNPVHGSGSFAVTPESAELKAMVDQHCNMGNRSEYYMSPETFCGNNSATLTITITPTTSGMQGHVAIMSTLFCNCVIQQNASTCNAFPHSGNGFTFAEPPSTLSPGFISVDQVVCQPATPAAFSSVQPASSGTPPTPTHGNKAVTRWAFLQI